MLPDTLTIVIVERRPAARAEIHSHVLILDKEGFVLPDRKNVSIETLPILHGLDPQGLVHGDPNVRQQVQEGIKISKVLTNRFGVTAHINFSDPARIVVDIRALRFRFGQMFEAQWERFLLLDASLENGVETASREIDLRFPGKVIIRERG